MLKTCPIAPNRTISKLLSSSVVFFSLFLIAHSASAGVVLAYNFEDGLIPNADSLMPNKIPTTILTESNGNHFLRMTASPEDCGTSFFTSCSRTRAELWIGSAPDTINQMVTYSFSMRIPSSNPAGQDNMLWQLFQGYRIDPAGGRTIWLGSQSGKLYVANQSGSGGVQRVELGSIQYDRWVNFSLVVYLSADPSLGRVDVYMDGNLIGSITEQATVLFTQYLTDMFLNIVDFNGAAGTADFDNLQISTGGLVPTPTPIPLLPPPSPTSPSLGQDVCPSPR